MVDERFWAGVGGEVELDEGAVDVLEVGLEGVEEAAGLEVFGGCAAGGFFLLVMMNYLFFWLLRKGKEKERKRERKGEERKRKTTHTETPSSFTIYPIPYPSAATGPNPNSLNAGFPQLDVDNIDVLRSCHPGSVKIVGSGDGLPEQFPHATGFAFTPLYPESVLMGERGRSNAVVGVGEEGGEEDGEV